MLTTNGFQSDINIIEKNNMSWIDQRTIILGYKPQKDIIYNSLLPYSTSIDLESNEQLAHLKADLARWILLRDLEVAGRHWCILLSKYIRIYGFKFSQEDHINFIKAIYSVLTNQGLSYFFIPRISQILNQLLKKKELINQEYLTIDWYPLYQIVKNAVFNSSEFYGLVILPENLEPKLKILIKHCRIYFPVEATKEILEKFRPYLCPFDMKMVEGIYFLQHFLPTFVKPELHESTIKLWFDELIGIWDNFQNEPLWESNLVELFSRLANEAIGYIDWEQYVPKIFTRFLRSLNLPVGTKNIVFNQTNDLYNVDIVAKWIVSMMSPKSSTQKYLDEFFKSLKSFYHPSNYGKWTQKLLIFINKLSFEFIKRIKREKDLKFDEGFLPIPKEHHLTDKDITDFVIMMREVAYLACFSKLGSAEPSSCLHNLAELRPELIVPLLIERTYSALETLTEPHRLISCLQCTVSVSRAMLLSPKYYPEGPTHIVPLLFACLPGIDANDIKKSLITFQLISTYSTLVPFVDCSSAPTLRNDLTKHDIEICEMTAQFEDFVLQFMDRVISLIEMSGHQHTRTDSIMLQAMSQEESFLDLGIYSAISSMLQQASRQIFITALDKIYRYTGFSIFESKVAGKLASKLVKAFVKVEPEMVLKKYMKDFSTYIIQKLESEDHRKDEHLDSELVWKLQLMSELVSCNGIFLLSYKTELMRMLELTLTLRSTLVNEMAWNLLKYLLRSLTTIYALDYKCTTNDLNSPMDVYFPIRDWGKSSNIFNLSMNWHVPSDEELDFASYILHQLLCPRLLNIKKHYQNEISIEREDLFIELKVILNCLIGASAVLPEWTGEHVQYVTSNIDLNRFSFIASMGNKEILLDGENIRLKVVNHIRLLSEFVLKNNEDDIKSLTTIVQIYNAILLTFGTHKEDFDARWKGRSYIKKFMGHQLQGKKQHVRAILVDRVQLQHELRSMHQSRRKLTSTHIQMYHDLYQLSLSSYREIRRLSQILLTKMCRIYSNSHVVLIEDIISQLHLPAGQLKIPQIKGLFHLILGMDVKFCMASSGNLDVLYRLWPALVSTQHCITPSIHRIFDSIMDTVNKEFHTKQLELTISDDCCEKAKRILNSKSIPVAFGTAPSQLEIDAAISVESEKNISNKKLYIQLIDKLVELVSGKSLIWKFEQIGLELISILMRNDIRLPVSAVKLFTKNLIDESLVVRKISVSAMCGILKQNMKKCPKIEYDPLTLSEIKKDTFLQKPGDHGNNVWVHYRPEKVPRNEIDWNNAFFVDKNYYGYYCWPKIMKKCDYSKLASYETEMHENDTTILQFLDDEEFIKKSLKFAAFEENKGQDRFNIKNYYFYRLLFSNYGPNILLKMREQLTMMIHDMDPSTHEASQRCAAEILAGLIKGAKYWPFRAREEMWAYVLPELKFILSSITIESLTDWGTCFATAAEDQDPHKIAPLIELVLMDPLSGNSGSFGDSSRLYVSQGVVGQQEWRIPSTLHRLLEYLKSHLDHNYKNVRDRIGTMLNTIFNCDIKFDGWNSTQSPQCDEFIQDHLIPLMQTLIIGNQEETSINEDSKLSDTIEIQMSDLNVVVVDTNQVEDNTKQILVDNLEIDEGSNYKLIRTESKIADERRAQIRLCKTVMKWIQGGIMRLYQCNCTSILQFLPIFASLECEKQDLDLRREVVVTMACMSRSLLSKNAAFAIVKILRQIANLPSWQARQTMLTYMQLCIFYNMFTLKSLPKMQHEISQLVLDRLLDESLEVRELAGVTLSGLFQCGFLDVNEHLIKNFKNLSANKLLKNTPQASELLLKRHAGIIGISAIILASPYEVPIFVPQLLILLSEHLHDPQPIQSTVKKTLTSFKRTHTDSWHEHKEKFTEDQLVVLTELLVSPNYYA